MNNRILDIPYETALLIIFTILFSIGCKENIQDHKQWYKGNLHTHSYWSDGDEFPEMIMDWYKSHGYHFVGLSDHNILAVGEKWKVIPQNETLEQGFEKYLDTYGEEWVKYKRDSIGLSVCLKPSKNIICFLRKRINFWSYKQKKSQQDLKIILCI